MTLSSGETFDKYRIKKYLGGGNFGEVYLATDLVLGGDFAIKLVEVDKSDAAILVQEARNLKACAHKHIVDLHNADLVAANGKSHLVIQMEYLKKGSLSPFLTNPGLSISDLLRAARQVAMALSHAHGRGIIHRDVKPGNVLVGARDYKLADFGLSFAKTRRAQAYNINYLPHCAPEISAAASESELSDVFALGMTIFRLSFLGFGAPNIGGSERQLWISSGGAKSFAEYLGWAEHVPRRLRAAINLMTAFDPQKRPSSAANAATLLDRIPCSMPWHRAAAHHFIVEGNTRHEAFIQILKSGKFELVHLQNNRRKNADCCEFSTEKQAVKGLNQFVAQTSCG